jgi:hypothetical protein
MQTRALNEAASTQWLASPCLQSTFKPVSEHEPCRFLCVPPRPGHVGILVSSADPYMDASRSTGAWQEHGPLGLQATPGTRTARTGLSLTLSNTVVAIIIRISNFRMGLFNDDRLAGQFKLRMDLS